jgi:hypothetical protein
MSEPPLDHYVAPPYQGERFDFIGWLKDFRRGEPVVWLYRRTRTAINIGRVEGDRYPSGRGREESYGVWAPAIVEPRPVAPAPDDHYGYRTQAAAVVAYVHDLQGDSSTELAKLKSRDREVATLVDAATSLDDRERSLMRGRATLHDLGAWPWAVVGDGILPERAPWWQRDDFARALREWDERGSNGLESIDPWSNAVRR